jgi:predicted nucleotidyltransferase
MMAITEQERTALVGLCGRYRGERLYIFGSAMLSHFDPRHRDRDFPVRFADREPTGEYADRYLGFAEALEQLFGRPVDLVTEESIRNPFFRREVESTRQLMFEQSYALCDDHKSMPPDELNADVHVESQSRRSGRFVEAKSMSSSSTPVLFCHTSSACKISRWRCKTSTISFLT